MRVHLAYNRTKKTCLALTPFGTAWRPGRRTSTANWLFACLLATIPLSPSSADTRQQASDVQAFSADFSLPSIINRDQNISLASFRGTTVYLDFWSSWCLPCRESLPLLKQLQAEFAPDTFAVVTVNLDAHPRDGRKLMSEFGIDYPVASDIAWRVAKQYGFETIPRGFLINADGEVRRELPRLNQHTYQAVAALISTEIAGNQPDAGAE